MKRSKPVIPSAENSDVQRCINCGRLKNEHRLVNYADGQSVGAAQLICPVWCFSAAEEPAVEESLVRTENPPHGPVSERFMRHHYGAKR